MTLVSVAIIWFTITPKPSWSGRGRGIRSVKGKAKKHCLINFHSFIYPVFIICANNSLFCYIY